MVSATFSAAMSNLVPAITFIMAVCLRMEKLAIKTVPGASKVVGSLVGIGGAMVFTLYKGAMIQIWPSHPDPFHMNKSISSSHANHPSNPALGSILAVIGCFCGATWYIIQVHIHATITLIFFICYLSFILQFNIILYVHCYLECMQGKMSKTYPCVLSCTALVSAMGTIQSVILALCTERDWSQWKLGWNIRLLGVAYAVCSFVFV